MVVAVVVVVVVVVVVAVVVVVDKWEIKKESVDVILSMMMMIL